MSVGYEISFTNETSITVGKNPSEPAARIEYENILITITDDMISYENIGNDKRKQTIDDVAGIKRVKVDVTRFDTEGTASSVTPSGAKRVCGDGGGGKVCCVSGGCCNCGGGWICADAP